MKRIKYGVVFLLIALFSILIVQALGRPQQVRTLLIEWYDFEKDGLLYYRSDVDRAKVDSLKAIIQKAEKRVRAFWGDHTATPKIIYCDNDTDYRKFGSTARTPAVAYMSIGASIVVHPSGLNLDVIAHELSHTELFNRIGYRNREQKIPVWFDEGLAMQVDWRPTYSIDTLSAWTNGLTNLPDVKKMVHYRTFGKGDVKLNYSTAKYEVGKWYTPDNLETFIHIINEGGLFKEAWGD